MLTTTAATVKFAPPMTPEQSPCSRNLDEGRQTFWSAVEQMQHAADQQRPIHQVEQALFRSLLVIGRALLQASLARAGTGDVGPFLTGAGDTPSDPGQELPRWEQSHKRPDLSLFGAMAIERTCYGHDRVEAAPWDAQLHRPQRQYSYWLPQRLGSFVVDDAHAAAVRKLGTILGREIPVTASEDLNREQASDVAVFPDRLPVPEAAAEGPLWVVTADCKGVPLVRQALPPGEATDAPRPALAHPRRGQGEGANPKKRAAVGAVDPIAPFVRTADDVIEEVMRKEARERRPRRQNKRVRAELFVGEVGLFVGLADEVIRRNPQGSKPVIFLSDGERARQDRPGEYLPEDTIWILDLYHVKERLWKVAWCSFDEKTQKHAAHQWVEGRLKRWLEGGVDAVIRGLRYQATQRGLKGAKRKTVPDAAANFARNRDRMKYDAYLAAGYPIGSGVVEGACRHLVKDRLERTGMRWLPTGVQAMLDLRATSLNGEWDAFWNFHVVQEDERLYGKIREAG